MDTSESTDDDTAATATASPATAAGSPVTDPDPTSGGVPDAALTVPPCAGATGPPLGEADLGFGHGGEEGEEDEEGEEEELHDVAVGGAQWGTGNERRGHGGGDAARGAGEMGGTGARGVGRGDGQ